MSYATPFDYVELPDCGPQTAEIARRLSPHYHCVFVPFRDESQFESLRRQGFYCRSSFTAQDLSLVGAASTEDCLSRLPAKRRNDIMSGVRKAQSHGIRMEIDIFRHGRDDFRNIYSWYFDVFRPYAATHFPNAYKYQFVEDFTADLLSCYRDNPFVFASAWLGDKIVGGSLHRHLPCSLYRRDSSFAAAFPDAPASGSMLQMYMLNSGSEPAGNINAFLYHSIIGWCIRQGYSFFSFGRENLILPPREYLNVLGSKRAWGTTTVLECGAKTQFVLCNRKALLHMDADYFVCDWEPGAHHLRYFSNEREVPKALSQWLEGDAYLRKVVYTRSADTFSYLEKRGERWNNTSLVLCDAEGEEETSVECR